MTTGTHDVKARVLQIAAAYDREFPNQAGMEYGPIRSQPNAPLEFVAPDARQHIRVLPLDLRLGLLCPLTRECGLRHRAARHGGRRGPPDREENDAPGGVE